MNANFLPAADITALSKATELFGQIDLLEKELGEDSPLYNSVQLLRQNLHTASTYLQNPEHTLAFIGSVGVGKTTAICHLLGLTADEAKPVLATGSGRTTLCEVVIKRGDHFALKVDPLDENEVLGCVRDFVDSLDSTALAAEEDRDGSALSSEVSRWLRNQLELPRRTEKDAKSGKRITVDEGRIRFQQVGDRKRLFEELWTKLNYSGRKRLEINAPPDAKLDWLKNAFEDVNNGRLADVPMPVRIFVSLPNLSFSHDCLDFSVVDTKGIDETAEREDLDRQIRCSRTVAVLCSGFSDAPEANATALLRHTKELGLAERLSSEFVLLVLERAGEADDVMDADGKVENSDIGRDVKFGQVEDALRNALRLSPDALLPTICFYNSKSDETKDTLNSVIDTVLQLRGKRRNEILEIEEAVRSITNQRERAITRASLEIVAAAVRSWIKSSRGAIANLSGFYQSLVDDMNTKRVHVSSIRASINRSGSWGNFDFYYKLASAAQKRAVVSFQEKLNELTAVLANLERQEQLRPAHPFIRQLRSETERHMERIYDIANRLGREVYEAVLRSDREFWSRQSDEWGRGKGYCNRVAAHTEVWFGDNEAASKEQLVQEQVMFGWRDFTDEIENNLLQETVS